MCALIQLMAMRIRNKLLVALFMVIIVIGASEIAGSLAIY